MVVDSSVLVAILLGEPEAELLMSQLADSGGLSTSAANLVETSIVLEARQGRDAVDDLHCLLADLGIEVVAFDEQQAQLAAQAWRRYGKGRHPAGLNLADCYAYACARALGRPLAFVGDDFTRTDIPAALA